MNQKDKISHYTKTGIYILHRTWKFFTIRNKNISNKSCIYEKDYKSCVNRLQNNTSLFLPASFLQNNSVQNKRLVNTVRFEMQITRASKKKVEEENTSKK